MGFLPSYRRFNTGFIGLLSFVLMASSCVWPGPVPSSTAHLWHLHTHKRADNCVHCMKVPACGRLSPLKPFLPIGKTFKGHWIFDEEKDWEAFFALTPARVQSMPIPIRIDRYPLWPTHLLCRSPKLYLQYRSILC